MKKSDVLFLFSIAIMFVFLSCNPNVVYDKFQTLPKSGWNKDSLVVFEIPVKDTIQNQNLYINVRNDISYKYSNLWLFIKIVQPGSAAVSDTFEITLADPSGKWLGEGLSGVKTKQTLYKRNIYFPISGNYKVNIQQGMRENILLGVTDIGLKLEKAD